MLFIARCTVTAFLSSVLFITATFLLVNQTRSSPIAHHCCVCLRDNAHLWYAQIGPNHALRRLVIFLALARVVDIIIRRALSVAGALDVFVRVSGHGVAEAVPLYALLVCGLYDVVLPLALAV